MNALPQHHPSVPSMPRCEEHPLAAIRAIKRDLLGFHERLHREKGDIVMVPTGLNDLIFLNHPDHVHHVLIKQRKIYGKHTRGYQKLRQVLGNGLVTSEGDFWMRQRRIALPAFHHTRLAQMGDKMVEATADLVAEWEPKAASGQAVNVSEEMMRLTLRIIGETMLSVDVTGEAAKVGSAVEEVLAGVAEQTMGLGLRFLVPTQTRRRFEKALETLDNVVLGIIEERRKDDRDRGDLLSMFMAIQDEETGERMTDGQLRDEVMTMFLAGHETTATALTWALYLLSRHPGERRRLVTELETVLEGRRATMADLKSLPLLDRVIKETMRLYPPVPIIARMPSEDDTIGPYEVPAGSYVLVSPYTLHRHPDFWENPEAFDPDRFLPERFADVPRLAYIPFSAGQRMCIGNRFATMEAALVLATILPRMTLDLVPGHPVVPEPRVTLRPRHGMKMFLKNRP